MSQYQVLVLGMSGSPFTLEIRVLGSGSFLFGAGFWPGCHSLVFQMGVSPLSVPICLSRWLLHCFTPGTLQLHHTSFWPPRSCTSMAHCLCSRSPCQCCLTIFYSSFKAQGKCQLSWDAFPYCPRLIPILPVLPQNLVCVCNGSHSTAL